MTGMNDILAGLSVQPEVGQGATLLLWSDRKPATVVAVSRSGLKVTVQEDRATRTDENGMSESQSYTYERDPEGWTYTFTLRKNGSWVEEGSKMRSGTRLALGRREKYYDFSF